MKMHKALLILLLGILINSSVSGQDFKVPIWINGTWNNSAESNTNNFEYWTFSKDSIYVIKGLPTKKSNRTCLNKKYSDYKVFTETNDSLFKLNFTNEKEIVIYEFRLQKVSYSDTPVLTYSLEIGGVSKRQHSTSCNLVLMKQ